jgi:hypothetical protein
MFTLCSAEIGASTEYKLLLCEQGTVDNLILLIDELQDTEDALDVQVELPTLAESDTPNAQASPSPNDGKAVHINIRACAVPICIRLYVRSSLCRCVRERCGNRRLRDPW